MLRARRHRRILLVLLSILGGALLVMALAYHWAGTRAQRAETAQLDRQLDLHAQALQQRIDRYRTLPQVLAQDPDLRDALAAPVDDARRNALNQRLEDANTCQFRVRRIGVVPDADVRQARAVCDLASARLDEQQVARGVGEYPFVGEGCDSAPRRRGWRY